jgi:hypothetical protein
MEPSDSQRRINNTIYDIAQFMATDPLPYFDSRSRATHVGLACRGCEFALYRAFEKTLSSRHHAFVTEHTGRGFRAFPGLFECAGPRPVGIGTRTFHPSLVANSRTPLLELEEVVANSGETLWR